MSANQFCENRECPICMDDISTEKNQIITECGHCFHASCLMANAAHNGFACPCCRSIMAEEPKDDEEEEDVDDMDTVEFQEDYTLRGFRFFMNNIDGREHSSDDIEDEEDLEEYEEEMHEDHGPVVPTPSVDFLVQKLNQQGVNMGDLVKILLLSHDEYIGLEDEHMRIDDQVFGKLRSIISNYTPEQEPEPEVVELPMVTQANSIDILKEDDEYFNQSNCFVTRRMMRVI
jgi:hypothetical protein